jgi:pyridoxamine 5'-phosphate oxidase
MNSLGDLRREYAGAPLEREMLHEDPIEQFAVWFAQAQRAELLEPNAMTLATADVSGRPSARIVLLKLVDARGFVFFTDYRSKKARDLAENPYAALTFLWKELERQVRVRGSVVKVTPEESQAYFTSRPRGSRIAAWASEQSSVLRDRAALEREVAQLTDRFGDGEIPLPPHWGGYRVVPNEVEFWHGQPDRLHDRFVYRLDDTTWRIERLSP